MRRNHYGMFRSPKPTRGNIDISTKRPLSTNKYEFAVMCELIVTSSKTATTINGELPILAHLKRCDALPRF